MRHALIITAFLALTCTLSACQQVQSTTAIAALSADQQRVSNAMAAWPNIPAASPALQRTFFATIHIAGRRTTASGILSFHNARDFRITAVTEMGVILFDGRMNWAGVTILRSMPGVDESIVGTLVHDLAIAFQLPTSLTGSSTKDGALVVKQTGADTNKYAWTFDSHSGHLRSTDVSLGLFDTLHIDYLRYNTQGWPQEMTVSRKARLYTISFTFTDDTFAQHDSAGITP
jgi:hypothetical protein